MKIDETARAFGFDSRGPKAGRKHPGGRSNRTSDCLQGVKGTFGSTPSGAEPDPICGLGLMALPIIKRALRTTQVSAGLRLPAVFPHVTADLWQVTRVGVVYFAGKDGTFL